MITGRMRDSPIRVIRVVYFALWGKLARIRLSPSLVPACWAGAYGALKKLDGVEMVRPIADHRASVAFLYLDHDGLPDLGKWPSQFAQFANGSYTWRGVEMTLEGTIGNGPEGLILIAKPDRPAVRLAPLQRADKVQLDKANGVDLPLPTSESGAYSALAATVATGGGAAVFSVAGPIKKAPSGNLLEVRSFRKV
jgi:galactose oxidase